MSEAMAFEFHLPSLEEMRATPAGMEMLRMIDDDNFRSALITGVPGSGKTTVSIYRLVRLYKQQANIHFLTFQNMLVLVIRNLAKGLKVPDSCVSTVNNWYGQHTGTRIIPKTAERIIADLDLTSLVDCRLDEILIDEGQDLPLCIFEAILCYANRCFVGADNNQQVHDHGAGEAQIEKLLANKYTPYKPFSLAQNFRNTYETYRFARQFIPEKNLVAWNSAILERLIQSNRRGPKTTVITYKDVVDRNAHLRITLDNAEGNVAILCPLGPLPPFNHNSGDSVDEIYRLITGMGFSATIYRNGIDVPTVIERYVVTTFISAKGMEFDTVIIPRINFWKMIFEEWYVACTRAQGRLFVYRDKNNPQCDPIARFDPDTYDSISLESRSQVEPETLF
jgi:superfamily I DNA/RNA helicase